MMVGRSSFSASSAAGPRPRPRPGPGRGIAIRVPYLSLLTLLLAQLMVVTSEIIALDMILDASSDEVHFVRGFLQAPASIDLSKILLITDEELVFDFGDDEYQLDYADVDDAAYPEDDEYEDDEYGDDDYEDEYDYETSAPSDRDELKTDVPVPVTQTPVIPSGDDSNNNEDVDNEGNESGGVTASEEENTNDTEDKGEEQESAPAIPSGDESNNNEDGNESGQENSNTDIEQNSDGEKVSESEAVIPSGDENNNGGGDEGNESGGETTGEEEKNDDEGNEQNEEPVPDIPSGDENNNGGGDEGNESGGETTNEEENKNEKNDEGEKPSEPVTPSGEETTSEEQTINEGNDKNEEPVPVIPSGDENNNGGGDKGNESEGETTNEEENKNEQNDEGEKPSEPVTPSGEETTSEEENINEGNDKNEEPVPDIPSGDENNNEDNEQKEEPPKDDEIEESPVAAPVSEVDTEEGGPVVPTEPAPVPAPAPSPREGGGDRSLQDTDAENSTIKQIMDIVLFLVPADCKTDRWGNCDWITLGVGSFDDEMEGGMSYCCSKDTAERGICSSDAIGTMMVNKSIFTGDHREVEVPSQPLQDFAFDDPIFGVEKSGDYVMIIANCNDDGLGVITLGNMEWKSVGGYLPGDIFGLMFFYAAVTAVYFVLGLWYYCGMKMFQEGAIPIQKYILATIVLGFLENSFRGMNLFLWNITGLRSAFVMYTALGLGILKQGSSRCLGVMVAMGWGVVRDTLGTTLIKIVFLGLLYSGLTLTRDFLAVAAEAVQKVSLTEEEELIDLALVLTPIIMFIDVIFYCWIISSLSSTTEYLRNMNQTSKLRRHMRLRCLIITSLIIVGLVMMVNIVQVFTLFLSQDQMWIIQAVTHANYLFILFGVAILWRPNSHARDYAMQMEIPAIGEGDNELELSCVVPSADDMDYDDGFKIDDAVAT